MSDSPWKIPLIRNFIRTIFLLVFLAVGYTFMNAFSDGLSLSEMDWNGDGWTSIGEIWETGSNRVVITVEIEGVKCRRALTAKGGMPVRTFCP